MRNRWKSAMFAVLLLGASPGYADILTTAASVRPNNSLIVDIQVLTGGKAAKLAVTYETPGVEPLVSRWTPVPTTGPATITRLFPGCALRKPIPGR